MRFSCFGSDNKHSQLKKNFKSGDITYGLSIDTTQAWFRHVFSIPR
jgi:hypothetical protein